MGFECGAESDIGRTDIEESLVHQGPKYFLSPTLLELEWRLAGETWEKLRPSSWQAEAESG